MADIRLYAQITLDFAENPKIECLSDAAFRQFIEALLWSRRQLTDGFITESSAAKRFTPEVIQELTTNHPTKPTLRRVAGGYQIHDFAEHQTTNADIEAKREAAKINGQKGGRPRKETQEETQTETQNKPNENPTAFENESQKKPENKAQSTESSREYAGEPLSPDYSPSGVQADWARENWPLVNWEAETAKFINFYLSKGEVRVDWDYAWSNWIINASERKEEYLRSKGQGFTEGAF